MIIVVVLLWVMGTVLFFTNPKSETIRWASYVGFFGGFGGLGTVLNASDYNGWIMTFTNLFTSFGHYLAPYAVLIFGLAFANLPKRRRPKNVAKVISLIPVLFMYYRYPVFPTFQTEHFLLALWIGPYVVTAIFLLLYATYTETRPVIKRQKVITCIVVIPMLGFALTANILLEAIGIEDVWQYNPVVIALQFILFVFFMIKYGFLGVRVRFEKQQDPSIGPVTSGTSLLNHTIKNEVAKIDMMTTRLKEQVPGDRKTNRMFDLMQGSTNHLSDLSYRIQSKLDTITLKEKECWLKDIIEKSISSHQTVVPSGIIITRYFEANVKLQADPVHLQECVLNIMKNAIDAMGEEGNLSIKTYQSRKKLFIDFIDSGKGIPKTQAVKVLDPFYSTKGKGGNYGLGLTYCFNVMQIHDGSISIKSQKNRGTTVTLTIPSKRIVEIG